jgi:hypothetical protein
MKRLFIPLFVMLLLSTSVMFSKDRVNPRFVVKENTISSLLAGVNSGNAGLVSSSAAMLGDLRSSEAVIPLMEQLKSSSDERVRIQAAISLWKIGDARGIYTIAQAVKFDTSERVKKICYILYLDTRDTLQTRF